MSHHGTGGNYGALTNSNAPQNDTFCTNPAAVAHYDGARCTFARTPLTRADFVTANDKLYAWPQIATGANLNISFLMSIKNDARAKPGSLADDQATSAIDPSATAKLHVRVHLDARKA